jgi:hypothetical protein
MLNLIYDRTAEDVQNGTAKGYYRHTDLNRVQAAVAYLRELYASYGYDTIPAYTLPTWNLNDIPKKNQGDDYIRATLSLDGRVPMPGKPALPASPDKLDYNGANAIEKFLAMTEDTLGRIAEAWFYCAEPYAGEVDV